MRVGLIALGLLLAGLLIVARCLVPDPSGLGTHEQLGLKPCLMLRLWQIRCPTCGMTTAWSHAIRGDVAIAVRANVGGTGLFLLAAIAMPWSLASGILGRWFLWKPTEVVVLTLTAAVVVAIVIEYLIRTRVLSWL